ncbi:MAG TPA: hypothetical protein PK000_02090, partial [Candidatus Saccharibacteria bacterium]|nr:hypothetical protein [Candidatus Saccharibacteria bacterium]
MKSLVSTLLQRSTLMVTSFILAISSLSAAMPLFLSQNANAISTITICDTSCDADSIQTAIDNANNSDVVSFGGNATLNHIININKPLTVNGNGHTIFSSFTKTGTDNNAAIGINGTTGVTIADLIIDGVSGVTLHGINVYESTDVHLNNITTKNNDRNGLVVNGSVVTVDNLHTSNNGWGGVDVDLGTGVTSPAVLNINGTSNQSEVAPVKVDDISKNVTVNDNTNQYVVSHYGNTDVYRLNPNLPVSASQTTQVVRPANLSTTGWYYWNDNTDTLATTGVAGEYNIVTDPADSNKGALEFNSPNKLNIATNLYAGTKLTDITAIGYSSYNTSAQNASTYMQFNVSFDGSNNWQNRLTFIPANSNGSWQQNEGIQGGNGLWEWSKMTTGGSLTWPDGSTSIKRTWNDIVTAFPNAKIQDGLLGQLLVRSEHNTHNYIDNVYLATNSSNIKYNFELPDTSKPTVSNISISPTVNSNIGRTVTVTFDLNDATGIDLTKTKVLFADGPNVSHKAKESAKFTPVLVSGNTYKVTVDTTNFLNQNYIGNYTLAFNLYDTLGNHGSTKPVSFRNILIDNSGPSATLVNPISGSVVNNTQRFTFNITDDTQVASAYVKFNGPTSKQLNLTHGSGDEWYVDVDMTTMNDGTYTLDVRPTDVFGTARYNANRGQVVVDNAAPVVSIDSPTGNLFNTDVQVRGSVTDPHLRHYWLNIKKDGVNIVNSTVLSSSFTNKLLATLTQEGNYVVTLAARDSAGGGSSTGNRSDDVVKAFTIDKTAPNVPNNLSMKVTSSGVNIPDGSSTNKNGITASWASNNTEPVTFIYKYWNDIIGNQYKVGSEYPVSTSSTSYAGVINQGQGVHHFCVVAVDLAGNESVCSAPFTVDYDTTAPAVTVNTPSAITVGTPTTTITGSNDSSSNVVTVSIDGAAPITVQPADVSDTGWSLVVDTSALGVGTHSITVLASDLAGNVSDGTAASANADLAVNAAPAAQPQVNNLQAPAGPGNTGTGGGTGTQTTTPGEVLGDQTTNNDAAKTG